MRNLALALLRIQGTSKIVMERRSKDNPIAPGLLGCFGGHIKKGETPIQAVKRELQEETSLNVAALHVTHLLFFEIAQIQEINDGVAVHLFEAYIPGLNFEVYEGDRAEAYGLRELLARPDLAPTARAVLMQSSSAGP